jgi:hypothetical protein
MTGTTDEVAERIPYSSPNLQPQTFKLKKKKPPVGFVQDEASMRSSASVDSFTAFQSASYTPGLPGHFTGLSSSTTHYEQDEEEEKKSMFSFLNSKVTNSFGFGGRPPVAAPEEVELSREEENEAFLLDRLKHSRQSTSEMLPEKSNSWFMELQQGFKLARDSLLGTPLSSATEIDWDFWGLVINDYENVIRQQPRQFQKQVHLGLPEPIRGMMWQLMCNSKSEALEEEYIDLLTRSSQNEKIIIRDLARTFPGHEFFKDPQGQGQTSLFNVLKGYSIYDKEIGYCQGLPFVVGPLLLNMPEEQAFCVLVRLMFDYNFRDLYAPKMIGLQVINHQFDRLLSGIDYEFI